MSDQRFRAVLKNDISEINRLGWELAAFGASCGLPTKCVMELNLILEEIATNIISYAYADDRRHEIQIQADLAQGTIVIEVEDDGRPFNPLLIPPPDFCAPLEKMPVGGRGLHLVKSLTDSIVYERTGGKNRLVLRKNIESACP